MPDFLKANSWASRDCQILEVCEISFSKHGIFIGKENYFFFNFPEANRIYTLFSSKAPWSLEQLLFYPKQLSFTPIIYIQSIAKGDISNVWGFFWHVAIFFLIFMFPYVLLQEKFKTFHLRLQIVPDEGESHQEKDGLTYRSASE